MHSFHCFQSLMFFISQVVLQSETIQELTKTSETLALLQEEASKLRKLADAQKIENVKFPTHRIFMFSVCFNFISQVQVYYLFLCVYTICTTPKLLFSTLHLL